MADEDGVGDESAEDQERASEEFSKQLEFVECLCHVGFLWKNQWFQDAKSIPMEADLHG